MERILEREAMDTFEEALAYDRIVGIYGSVMNVPHIANVKKFIKRENTTILDIGTGPGLIPIGIAREEKKCKIYAIDISSHMLKVAHEKIEREGLDNRIILQRADAKFLPFKDNSFDIVSCCNVLHHFKDPIPVLNEMARVVKRDDTILIRDLIRPPLKLLLNFIVTFFGMSYDEVMKKEYRDSLCASFTMDEIKSIISCSNIKRAKVNFRFPHFVDIIKEGYG